ncbi:MAG: hypothetical protein ACKVP0_25525, partial [Pirellulaceae bacterium]
MGEQEKFASEILASLRAAGVRPLPTYDSASNMLVLPPTNDGRTVHFQLAKYFDRYRMAMHPRAKEQVLDDFVQLWLSGSLEISSLQPHRWLPLLRSRWHFEVSQLRIAKERLSTELQQAGLFAYQLITEDLVLAVGEDQGATYRFLGPLDLKQAGLTLEQAMQRAFVNLPLAGKPGHSGSPFEEVSGFAWMPTGSLDEHSATRLLDIAAIRKLPVRGQHVAFAPHTNVLWISGTHQHTEVELLIALTLEEFANSPGQPLLTGPLVLEEEGRWQPWQPAPTHPNYWGVKQLHVLCNDERYQLQKEVLDQLPTADPNPPFVASYRAIETGFEGNSRLYSCCVIATTSLLPRTEFVMLRPTINEAELAANPNAEPQFGESLTLPWESFAAFHGENLKAQGMYPERYFIDQFPDDMEWKKLQVDQQKVPQELLDILLRPHAHDVQPSPADRRDVPNTAVRNGPSANWVPAVILGVLLFPAALVLIFSLLFYFLVWIPSQLARNAPRPLAGQRFPAINGPSQVNPRPFQDPRETQIFAAGEWQPMDEPFALPLVEGAMPVFETLQPGDLPAATTAPDVWGERRFSDRSPRGEPLVGLRIIQGDNWGGAVQALQPIYLAEDRYFLGGRCGNAGGKRQAQSVAEPGYAIGAIEVHQGLVVNAVRIEYWRLE